MTRGRPKGSKNKPKVIETSPGAGHNSGLTGDQLQALTLQHKAKYQKSLAAKKEADAAFRNICKQAKAELGEDAIDDIKLAIELDSEEGQARLKADMERRARVAAWFGLEIGTQGALFAPDRTPVEDKAFAEGKRAGMEGTLRSAPQHYAQDIAERWYQGYDAGQTIIRGQMKDAFTTPHQEQSADTLDEAFDDAIGDADEEDDGESEEESEDETAEEDA